MRPVEGFPVGEYMVVPMAWETEPGAWQAGLALGGEPARGTPREQVWRFEQPFASRDEAIGYATAQGELWASDPDTHLKPRLDQ